MRQMYRQQRHLLQHFNNNSKEAANAASGKENMAEIEIRKAEASRNGILLYSQKRGSHYCSYRIRHDGSIYVFNAVYGKNRHRITIDEFLSTYAKGIKLMLLYVERP